MEGVYNLSINFKVKFLSVYELEVDVKCDSPW